MQVRTSAFICFSLVVIIGMAVSACSDSNDSDEVTPTGVAADGDGESPVGPALLDQPEPAQAVVASETAPVSGAVDVAIEGAAFVNNNIVVPSGETVDIRVANNDPVTHNLRIAGLDGEFNTEDDAVTDPQAITAGESGELTFAPPVAGAYTFRCDFHANTMGGRITVE